MAPDCFLSSWKLWFKYGHRQTPVGTVLKWLGCTEKYVTSYTLEFGNSCVNSVSQFDQLNNKPDLSSSKIIQKEDDIVIRSDYREV